MHIDTKNFYSAKCLIVVNSTRPLLGLQVKVNAPLINTEKILLI